MVILHTQVFPAQITVHINIQKAVRRFHSKGTQVRLTPSFLYMKKHIFSQKNSVNPESKEGVFPQKARNFAGDSLVDASQKSS